MSDNTREPENSTNEDVEAASARNQGNVYARAGRVAPQEIPATTQQAAADAPEAKSSPYSENTPTVTFNPHEDFEDDVDVPVAQSHVVSKPKVPPHPSDAPTTVFEPQSAETKHTPSGEPTVMFDAPNMQHNAGFSLPEPGEPPRDDAAPYPSQADDTFAAAAPAAAPEHAPVAAPNDQADAAGVASVDARRGTIDFGIFIIRFVFGALLVFSAVKTFFQLGGNTGLAGLEAEYANYLQPGILAVAIPAMLLTAGVFLVLGLVTPVAAALATVGTAFQALHMVDTDGEVFNPLRLSDSVWLALLLVVLSIGLQFTGPGRIALDFSRSWSRRPLISSWLFAVLGLAGAGALWWFGAGVNPFN